MTQIQFSDLKAKLYADESLAGLTADQIASTLSVPLIVVAQPCFYTDKTLVRDLETGTALTLLGTISIIGAGSTSSAPFFQRIGAWLTDGTGIDLGLPKTREMIDEFVGGGLLTADQGQNVKALAETTSYPQGGPCGTADVSRARASNTADAAAVTLSQQLSGKFVTGQQRLAEYTAAVFAGQNVSAPTLTDLLA